MKSNTMKGVISRVLALALLGPGFVVAAPAATAAQATEYDYVVVGSGPGGGPLAVNLAKAGYSVFLIEAGDASTATGFGQYPPSLTWDFFVNHYPEDDPRNNKYSHLTWRTPEGRYWVGQTGAPAGSKVLGVYYPRGKASTLMATLSQGRPRICAVSLPKSSTTITCQKAQRAMAMMASSKPIWAPSFKPSAGVP
ncbi:hypothetical protein O1611_g45 [Lasiodiplodia mahajangana]|uniref:Uncharacterized protein n=1 Tax=Lasiodiplodia mahajangana TaxID=1108764 RepID=A0ACC2K1A3_9PEZI|nr:hypothetical protein O1611_g45 [Lasiodiplodia mahajangana]